MKSKIIGKSVSCAKYTRRRDYTQSNM